MLLLPLFNPLAMLVIFYLQTKYKWCSVCPRLLAALNSGCGNWPQLTLQSWVSFHHFIAQGDYTLGWQVDKWRKNETKWRTEKTHEIGKWKRNREKSMRKKADTVLRQWVGGGNKEISLLNIKCNDKASNNIIYDFRAKFSLWSLGTTYFIAPGVSGWTDC